MKLEAKTFRFLQAVSSFEFSVEFFYPREVVGLL